MPRFNAAVLASTTAILTLLPCSTRRRAAASSRACLSAAAAAAAEAGPSANAALPVLRGRPTRDCPLSEFEQGSMGVQPALAT